MKKVIIFIILLTLFGCTLSNTPTSKVEQLMTKYQLVDDDIKKDIENILSDDSLTFEQKNRYKKLLENQYKNLQYEIKDEEIDGNKAIVTISIEVLDYKKTIDKLEENIQNYEIEKYKEEKLKELEKTKDKITYTLKIEVLKDNNGTWYIDDLTNENKKKIQGMY